MRDSEIPAGERTGSLLATALSAGLLFTTAACTGLGILVALFMLGVAAGIDILFYRGLLLCGLAFGITVLLFGYLGRATRRASWRDAIAAGFLSLGVNVAFLIVVPVTVDRSISTFILSYMAAHPDRAFTTREIELAFTNDYVGRLRQIERRMHEQEVSGNVRRADGGYAISPQGLSFVAWARRISWLFGTDRRLIDVGPPDTAVRQGSGIGR
jgi:hypothetical protein